MSRSTVITAVRPALTVLLLLTVLTGVVYPLGVTLVAGAVFPAQANGSLIQVGDRTYGSGLIGQGFTDPGHLWSRPSAAGAGWDANLSAGSNLAPTSRTLVERVTAEAERLRELHGEAAVPVDLVTTSASGLDPHLSPAAARYQVARIAAARGMAEADVQAIVDRFTEGPVLGILGTHRVNVLRVNLALDGVLP